MVHENKGLHPWLGTPFSSAMEHAFFSMAEVSRKSHSLWPDKLKSFFFCREFHRLGCDPSVWSSLSKIHNRNPSWRYKIQAQCLDYSLNMCCCISFSRTNDFQFHNHVLHVFVRIKCTIFWEQGANPHLILLPRDWFLSRQLPHVCGLSYRWCGLLLPTCVGSFE